MKSENNNDVYVPFIRKSEKGYDIQDDNNIISYVYKGSTFVLKNDEMIEGLIIKINGNNNIITIGENNKFINCYIVIGNNDANIIINENNKFIITKIRCSYGNNQKFIVGKNNFIQGNFYLDENSSFLLGDSNIFSQEVKVWCSDGHSIIDNNTKKIINKPLLPVVIKNHRWIGYNVSITKNVQLPNNTIVGLASVVTKKFFEENTVVAGNPAKIVKRNVTWDIRNSYYIESHKQ